MHSVSADHADPVLKKLRFAAAEVSSFRLLGVVTASKLFMREVRELWRTSRMASEGIDEGPTLL